MKKKIQRFNLKTKDKLGQKITPGERLEIS